MLDEQNPIHSLSDELFSNFSYQKVPMLGTIALIFKKDGIKENTSNICKKKKQVLLIVSIKYDVSDIKVKLVNMRANIFRET